MKRLLKNDFYKMRKEKAHMILLIVCAVDILITVGFMALIGNMSRGMSSETKQALAAAGYLNFMSGSNMGMFVALSISIYLGNDFKNRTINIKVLSGHSRRQIFWGIIIINLCIFIVFFIFSALLCMGLSGLFFGGFGPNFKDILIKTALMLPLYIAIISVATFVSLSLKSVLGIVINLLIIIVLSSAGQIISTLAAVNVQNDVLKFISEIVPYFALSNIAGGGLLGGVVSSGAASYPLDVILKNIISAVLIAAGAITGGYFIFRSKPLA